MEREAKCRKVWAAHQQIIARSETIKARTGIIQPTSTDMIRNFREGEGRRD